MPIAKSPAGIRIFSCFLLCAALAVAPVAARAQSDEAVDKVTKMNKKAVEEYENLNFEEARKILKEALDFCGQNGLDKHPVKARTHIHLGIVILAGFKQREVAIKQFRKALEIQPDIKLTKSLANPEVQEAFDEAVAGMGSPEKPDTGGDKGDKADKADKGAEKTDKGAEGPITHDPVAEGTQGAAITITAHVDYNLGVKKMILAYRPESATEFLGRVMKEVTQGNWTGDIPASATLGNRVAYYLEAQGPDDATLGTKGTADDPIIIVLKGSGAPDKGKPSGEEEEEEEGGPSWYIGLGLGTGFGYATGSGEVNVDVKLSPAGFAPASLGHVLPEVGYFLKPNLIFSVQLRLQIVSGATDLKAPTNSNDCGSDHVCSAAKNAVAGFAKLTYLLGDGTVKPYVSAALGGGQIRHVASFPVVKLCGANGMSECSDTILAGPVFVGPGGGVLINVSDNVALNLGIATQLGFPNFTFNFDFNAGVAVEF
ncbi:MAG TPA: tetratricopeptide repeat protein [Polyangia bacterium]